MKNNGLLNISVFNTMLPAVVGRVVIAIIRRVIVPQAQ